MFLQVPFVYKFQLLQARFELDRDSLVHGLTHWPVAILGAAVAIGFLTMTVIEIFKISLRWRFNRHKVLGWLYGETFGREFIRSSQLKSIYRESEKKENHNLTDYDLVLLSTAGNAKGLYSLSIENLCGQLMIAAQTALDQASDFPELVNLLVGKKYLYRVSTSDDLNSLLKSNPSIAGNEYYLAARNRIGAHIQRNIDSLQIDLTFAWKKRIRFYSFIVSFCIALVGSTLFTQLKTPLTTVFIFAIFIAYTGGFLASYLRDIISLIEKFKK